MKLKNEKKVLTNRGGCGIIYDVAGQKAGVNAVDESAGA